MKIVTKLTLLAIGMASLVLSGNLRGKPGLTPKAADLGDHFGTEPVKNLYGPKTILPPPSLMREGVTGKGTPIIPINNFYKEINPTAVASGDLDNTSYDASKIVKPAIAGKFHKHHFLKNNFLPSIFNRVNSLIFLNPFKFQLLNSILKMKSFMKLLSKLLSIWE